MSASPETNKDSQKNRAPSLALLTVAGLVAICSLSLFGYLAIQHQHLSTEHKAHANHDAASEPSIGLSTEQTPAEIKVSEIRTALLKKYNHQKIDLANSTIKTKDNPSLESLVPEEKTVLPNEESLQDNHDHHEHEHDHSEKSSNHLTVINALSPEMIAAVNSMTSDTEVGTRITTSETGNVMVDMGETAFRAVPVATVDEKGNITIAEFMGPIANTGEGVDIDDTTKDANHNHQTEDPNDVSVIPLPTPINFQ